MHLFNRATLGTVIILTVLLGAFAAHGSHLFADAPADSGADLASRLGPHLVVLDKDGTFKPYDAAALKNVKYVAYYLSASWCPPCRIFTPKLVKFYDSFKPQHPDFELIFVNHDASAADMLAYMKSESMTWPAVRYDDIDATKLNDMDPNGGIPDLILTDANGKVLSDTFNGSDYLGPDKVVDDIRHIVH